MVEGPKVTLSVEGVPEVYQLMRVELAKVIRQHADREAGPVGIRLRQIADAFERGE